MGASLKNELDTSHTPEDKLSLMYNQVLNEVTCNFGLVSLNTVGAVVAE